MIILEGFRSLTSSMLIRDQKSELQLKSEIDFIFEQGFPVGALCYLLDKTLLGLHTNWEYCEGII